ncbi:hypothetical protein [Virgibacillus salexigens]|uniref:hypothetical protein n=1 Tax=Virgibacillus salexigens TaxID=61016 RepID=UPI00190958ED|nr:hypothetical protein [Virgibacillus salexigens]
MAWACFSLSYLFIIKQRAKLKLKVFSLLAVICFAFNSLLWNEKIFVFVTDINPFLPIVSGVLGIIFGWYGMKGDVRISILLANTLTFILYLLLFIFFGPWAP